MVDRLRLTARSSQVILTLLLSANHEAPLLLCFSLCLDSRISMWSASFTTLWILFYIFKNIVARKCRGFSRPSRAPWCEEARGSAMLPALRVQLCHLFAGSLGVPSAPQPLPTPVPRTSASAVIGGSLLVPDEGASHTSEGVVAP